MLFGFFALVLILVFWVNTAVALLDRMMGDGQSAAAFFYLTLLSLPSVMSNVLAIAAFVATVFVINRLSSESELVVVQASGYSPFRLARPILSFALFVTALIAILSHILVPLSLREGDLRRAELAQDLTAKFLTEGSFIHPADNITFYVREITPAGELQDIYLTLTEEDGSSQSYTATRALLVKEDAGVMLLMFDGAVQHMSKIDRRLSVTRFENFAYSLGGLINPDVAPTHRLRAADSVSLVTNADNIRGELSEGPRQIYATIHERNGEALLAIAAVLIGYAALVAGGFSRFGLWKQILFSIVLLIVVKTIDNMAARSFSGNPDLWPLVYTPAIAGAAIAYGLMWWSAHPFSVRRRRPAPTQINTATHDGPTRTGGSQ